MLENRLPSTLHIGKYSLSEMPFAYSMIPVSSVMSLWFRSELAMAETLNFYYCH